MLLVVWGSQACSGVVKNPQGEVVDDRFVRTTALALDRANDTLAFIAGEVKLAVEAGLLAPEKRDVFMAEYYNPAVDRGKKADQALTLYEGFPDATNQADVDLWLGEMTRFVAELLVEAGVLGLNTGVPNG
jgi:hypothetical protein